MTIKTQHYPLIGGTDMVTPALAVAPGAARASNNYEPTDRGYQRVDGYEHFDGQPKPSAASYWILFFDAGDTEVVTGDLVFGNSTENTGVALIDGVLQSGTYAGGDAAGYLVLGVSGAFQDNEELAISPSVTAIALANGTATESAATTDTLNDTYLQAAIELNRTTATAVPGSGQMRGVWTYAGDVYAFRNAAGGATVAMYKATASGWSLQDLGETLTFTSGGTTEIAEGDTVTGSVSGETAVVKRVIVTSGTWAGGDAAGRLIVYSVSGAFQAENLEVSAANLATIAADAVPNTLAPNGRFEFVNYNFGGHAGTNRMYGADGVSLGFEWDGSVFVPIITGMTTDTPAHVYAHKKHLFYSFSGGSVQHSGIGTPYVWTVISGAAEIAIGEEVTGFSGTATKALLILGRNKMAILYGTSASDWELVELTNEAGAIEWTVQLIGSPIYMDDLGLRSLDTTQKYGDFKLGTLSRKLEPIFKRKKKASISPIGSIRVRSKDQYRVFFSDGSGVTLYLGRKEPELMAFDLGFAIGNGPKCFCSGEDSSGNEVLFFGENTGKVMQLDVGTSFDGAIVQAYLRLPFNTVGSPAQEKQWRKATIETTAGSSSTITVFADFSYADSDKPAGADLSFTVRGGGGFWNEDNWNEFLWSAPVEGVSDVHLEGIGTNMSLTLRSEAIYEEVHTHHGLILHYSPLRLKK